MSDTINDNLGQYFTHRIGNTRFNVKCTLSQKTLSSLKINNKFKSKPKGLSKNNKTDLNSVLVNSS